MISKAWPAPLVKKLLTPRNILLAILVGGLILRVLYPLYYFRYQHDQDLIGWILKDILYNHHFRLIGQETSSQGVFIGPYFYYLLIPFYLVTSMHPGGGIIMVTLLGLFAIFSFYYVFSKIFDKKIGLIAALIYAVSYTIIFTDREVAPTMPVMLWSVWYLYGLWLILKGKSKAYLLLGFLLGLVWHLNLALAILTPLIPLTQVLSKKKLAIKEMLLGVVIFVVTLSPFFVFEARHGFSQTQAILSSLTSSKDYEGGATPGLAKLDRVMQVAYINTTRVFWGAHYPSFVTKITFYLLIIALALLTYKKILSRSLVVIMTSWLVLYITFFSLNPLNISEYYLNGMNVIWITIIAVSLARFRYKFWVLAAIVSLNLYSFSMHISSRNGYVEKMQLINFIKSDSATHGYPCVSISYITSGGYQFGYRYLFWRSGLRVNKPLKGSPIYSIVFPLSYVNKFDRNFGALGLVLPEYASYTKERVNAACEGVEDNLTEPMFGYTQ